MRSRRIVAGVLVCLTSLLTNLQGQDASAAPEQLTINQAVNIALANNRYLKIVSLDLDISKDKVAAAKTSLIERL